MSSGVAALTAALADRYAIEQELGAGGMATVYLAEDLKHHRKVAIKVLKPELAAVLGAERFVQEITTTAALQHPNILPLFDSGTVMVGNDPGNAGPQSYLYYVMPFIDGETVRGRLDRETQLGVDLAVRITRDVADALDYAHQHGVIHRDIKPENILLANGRPIVADFGIALAVSAAAGGRMTETGLSLGTPHYMSPEQATAEKEITARSDIYSLGTVLYEMLTGSPPHTGASAQQIIMKIVTEDAAPVTTLRKSVPPNVAAALGKSLEKLPADRFATAREFADALANPAFRAAGGAALAAASDAGPWRRRFYAAVALGVLLIAGFAGLGRMWRSAPSGSNAVPPSLHLRLACAPGDSIAVESSDAHRNADRPSRTAFALSPDGRTLVYRGQRNGMQQLLLRPLNGETATPIPGTERAESPFFSPDGKSLGFWVGGKLRRLALAGGPPTDVATVGRIAGASWSETDRIAVGLLGVGLIVFPVTGTAPPDTLAEPGAMLPQWLPGAQAIVFTKALGSELTDLQVEVLSLKSGKRHVLVSDAADARYLSTGHLIFGRRGTLMAVPFDVAHLETMGSPIVVLDDVMQSLNGNNNGLKTVAMQLVVTPAGQLAYLTGGITPDRQGQLFWLDRTGAATPVLAAGMHPFLAMRISPDGKRFAATIVGTSGAVQVFDLVRQTSQLFANPGDPEWPLWTPDGKRVAYVGKVRDSVSIVWAPADGSRPAEPVVKAQVLPGFPVFWSPDGSELFAFDAHGTGLGGIVLTDGARRPIPNLPKGALWPTLSPDGKWLAYGAVESAATGAQVFVQPWPALDRKWKVSTGEGAYSPAWTKQGRELTYLAPAGADSDGVARYQVAAVEIGAGPGFVPGTPRVLFTATFGTTTPLRSHDVTPDGSHFLVDRSIPVHAPPGEIHVVVNWFAELRQLLAEQGGHR